MPKGARRSPRLTLESLFVATIVLFGFRLGARPITDNSMLTHLRTGIDIVRSGGIPRTDPYSFTAHGRPWVVQSWLLEWTYGWAHRLGGFRLVVLEQALLTALLAWLLVRLARAGTPLRTGLAGCIAVGIGSLFWSPRPLLFGLICLALTVTVVERRRSPWLLVPLVWVWVNSHGSFPLGLVWLGARAAGEALDWRAWPRQSLRYAGGFVAGMAASLLNPLGARLLLFPLTLAGKQDVFARIIEWQSPNFQRAGGPVVLAFLALALAVFMRARLAWRDVVPVVVFVALALTALRNVPAAAVVLAPVLSRALRPAARTGLGGLPAGRERARERVNRAFAATIAFAYLVFALSIGAQRPLALNPYPEAAAGFLDRQGLLAAPHRVAHQDEVGNYLTFRFGRRARVFIDDRYDMFPARVSSDYFTLLRGRPGALQVLDRWNVDVVLWRRDLALVTLLKASGWQEAFTAKGWVVLRRPPPRGGAGP